MISLYDLDEDEDMVEYAWANQYDGVTGQNGRMDAFDLLSSQIKYNWPQRQVDKISLEISFLFRLLILPTTRVLLHLLLMFLA